jgi:hypothetical protein
MGFVVPRRIAQAQDVRERALVEEGFSAHHAPDAPEEDGRSVVLVEDPRRPLVQEEGRLGVGEAGRHDEHPAGIAGLARAQEEGRAALRAEIDVEQDDVDGLGGERVERFLDGGAVTRDLEVRLRAEEPGQALAEEGVVVHEKDADLLAAGLGHGQLALATSTTKQLPRGRGS